MWTFSKLFVALKTRDHTHFDSMEMDGETHVHMIENGMGDGAIQFAVDYDMQYIFYADGGDNRIAYIDFDG